MPGIGHPLFMPGERIERREIHPVKMHYSYGYENDNLVLLWTTAQNALGKRTNGRVLITTGPYAGYVLGGAFWTKEGKQRCVQSIWIEPEYRFGAKHIRTALPTLVDRAGAPIDLAAMLGKMLRGKPANVTCALEPMSAAGLRWVTRQGFAIVK